MNGRNFSLRLACVDIVMLGSIFLAMSLDFATLTLVKKVRNLQHENLPIQDINFPTKNSKSPDLGSRMYHMYANIQNQQLPHFSINFDKTVIKMHGLLFICILFTFTELFLISILIFRVAVPINTFNI